MGLELLAIALRLSTFSALCAGRRVVVWSDNTGSERGAQKGTSKQWDHSAIVHCLWLKAVEIGMDMHVSRVPTHDNIADLPSREEYGLLKHLGASWTEPLLDDRFWRPSSWEALKLVDTSSGCL